MSMPPVPPPAETGREPMHWLVKFALAGTAVVVFVGLYAWLEHERAKASVAAYRRQLTDRGEKLDLKDHLPAPVKLEENAAPELLAAIAGPPDMEWDQHPGPMQLTAIGRARVAWRQMELPNENHEDVWPFVIANVESQRATLAAVAKALERPHWQVAMNYQEIWKAEFAQLQKIWQLARLQSEAVLVDLHNDQPQAAFTNLLAMARFCSRPQRQWPQGRSI